MKKRIIATVFSTILSLFLAIVLLATCLCYFARQTVCDPQLLTDIANDSGYTAELYEQIKYKWENLVSITGVTDPDSIMQVLTQEQVQEDALAYLQDAYTGTATIDTEELSQALRTKVSDYAYSNNIHATPKAELEQNIDDLVAACIQDYKTSIRIPLLPRLLGTVSQIPAYLKTAIQIGWVSCFVLLVFIFFLQKKRTYTLYFAAISTATNALLLLGGCWLIRKNQLIERLPIDISALRALLCAYLSKLVSQLESFGYLFLQATLVLLAVHLLNVSACALVRYLRAKKNTPAENE